MQYGSMSIHDVKSIEITERKPLPGVSGMLTQDIQIMTTDGDKFRLICFLANNPDNKPAQ